MLPEAVLSGGGQTLEQSVLRFPVGGTRVTIVVELDERGQIDFFRHQGSDGQVLTTYSSRCFNSLNLLRRASHR